MVENCCGGDTLMSDIWRRTLATVPSGNASDPHGTTPENEYFNTGVDRRGSRSSSSSSEFGGDTVGQQGGDAQQPVGHQLAWIPHAVVINLGTNDALDRRPENVAAYNTTYLSLVMAADASYGHGAAHFFLACGPMATSYCGAVDWVIGEASARGVKASFLDQRGFLDGSHGPACCGHPSATVDGAMALNATEVIKAAMGWA
jgi:hypothetical protein